MDKIGPATSVPTAAPAPQPAAKTDEQPPVEPRDRADIGSPQPDNVGYAKKLDPRAVKAQQERDGIYKDMVRGVNPAPDEKVEGNIKSAMNAFSLDQLRAMKKNGVRIWFPDGKNNIPPELGLKGDPLNGPGQYKHQTRVIQLNQGTNTDAIRHEMAHAWDDVRNNKNPVRLDDISEDARIKELNRIAQETSPFHSDSARFATRDGSGKAENLTVQEMLDRYRSRTLKEDSFGNGHTAEGYSRKNTREFYAEGYSVFHGHADEAKAKMLANAPELYNHMEAEAVKNGLPIPDRKELQKLYPVRP